jgi:hypothetical protein
VGSNPTGAWIFVCCECRVLSGRGLCDELITRPEESYRLWYVVVCDLETSRICAPYMYDISSLRVKHAECSIYQSASQSILQHLQYTLTKTLQPFFTFHRSMSRSNLRHHKGITNLKDILARSVFSQQNQKLVLFIYTNQIVQFFKIH